MSDTVNPADLTKLMLFFGKIPETHIKSIQSYPFIYFNDHLADPKLDYSVATIDKNEPTVFKYDLTLNLETNDFLDMRYKALERAIRDLFWVEAQIEVNINGTEVYRSEQRKRSSDPT